MLRQTAWKSTTYVGLSEVEMRRKLNAEGSKTTSEHLHNFLSISTLPYFPPKILHVARKKTKEAKSYSPKFRFLQIPVSYKIRNLTPE